MLANFDLLTTSQSTENNLVKVWVAATGAQLDRASFNWLFGLYQQGTDYQVVSAELESYMNGVLSNKGGNLLNTVSELITNGTGVARSDASVQSLINSYTSEKGIDSWTKLFAYWITNPDDEVGGQLEQNALSKLIDFGIVPPPPEPETPITNPEVPTYENPLPTDKYLPGDGQDFYVAPKVTADNWGDNTTAEEVFIGTLPVLYLLTKIGNKEYSAPTSYVQETQSGTNIVLDFGGGAKTAVFDYDSANIFQKYFVYLWNFNSDDKIVFVNDTALDRSDDASLNRFYPTLDANVTNSTDIFEKGYILRQTFDDPLLDDSIFVDGTPLEGYGTAHEYGGVSLPGAKYDLILDQYYSGYAAYTGSVSVVGVTTNDFVELSTSKISILS